MGSAAFRIWLDGIHRLDASQRGQAIRALVLTEAGVLGGIHVDDGTAFPDPVCARPLPAIDKESGVSAGPADLMARIGRSRVATTGCPHCDSDDIRPWGRAGGKPRYRCVTCSRTFNPLTGTPLSGLHYPNRWGDQAQALIEGETVAKAAARCGVDYTTAFRWRHRFLKALTLDKPTSLSGIVEADETFILESFKGKRRDLPRVPRKRGGKAAKRGLSAEQIPVIVARDRTGATIDGILPRLDAASITMVLGPVVEKSAQFCCDGGTAIKAYARRAGVTIHVLPAPGTPRPEAPDLHINNVNAYHGRLKEWMRRFHGVATANLPNYLSWRRTIEALGNRSTQEAWIMGAAGLGPYQQASQ